jgi:predicted DNA-binding transcriptional regulator AlpA
MTFRRPEPPTFCRLEPAPEALSVERAARAAGVSRTLLYERIRSGELPTSRWAAAG